MRVALGGVAAVVVLALAVKAANTDWAILVAALAVVLVFSADRVAAYFSAEARFRRRFRRKERRIGSRLLPVLDEAARNARDWLDAA